MANRLTVGSAEGPSIEISGKRNHTALRGLVSNRAFVRWKRCLEECRIRELLKPRHLPIPNIEDMDHRGGHILSCAVMPAPVFADSDYRIATIHEAIQVMVEPLPVVLDR
jgi:hypothetical protein